MELDPIGMAAPLELPDAELPDFELGENDIPGVSLEGLGDAWEKDHTIRARAVSSKNLLASSTLPLPNRMSWFCPISWNFGVPKYLVPKRSTSTKSVVRWDGKTKAY